MAFCHIVSVGGSDLGGRKRDREFRALGWHFSALCCSDGAILVLTGERGNLELVKCISGLSVLLPCSEGLGRAKGSLIGPN